MTFRKYICGLRLTHDGERSAFIREVRSDKSMPELKNWDELEAHLQTMGANTDSFHQARVMWLNYYQWACGYQYSRPSREHQLEPSLAGLG
jgi:hypothetical protein